MKTRFEGIEVNIDETTYVVSYSFATPKQKEELEALSKTDDEANENYLKHTNEMQMLEAKRTNNEALIPHLEGAEKVEVLKEQREIISKIEKLIPKLEKAGKHQLSQDTATKKYELLVGGVDKDRLREDALKLNIPISVVMNEIIQGVVKAKEKK